MGTNCVVYLANFYLFSYEFDFLKHLLKNNICPVVLHRLSLVPRFLNNLFVLQLSKLLEFYAPRDKDSFGDGICPKTSCELN
jgi:hypothetical protein